MTPYEAVKAAALITIRRRQRLRDCERLRRASVCVLARTVDDCQGARYLPRGVLNVRVRLVANAPRFVFEGARHGGDVSERRRRGVCQNGDVRRDDSEDADESTNASDSCRTRSPRSSGPPITRSRWRPTSWSARADP